MQKTICNNSLTVFPTARSVREYINNSKSKNQLLQKIIPIGEFFQLSVLHKIKKNSIDKNLKIIYLKEAILNSDIEKLGLSRDFSTFLKQSEYIFRFFLETANEYVKFESLLESDTYALYSDHIEVLQEVYINYTKLLEKNNYTDNILMPNEYLINIDYIQQFDFVTIYLEGYLSSYEFKIIRDISKIVSCNIKISFNQFNEKNFLLFNKIKDNLKTGHSYTIDLTNEKIIDEKKTDFFTKSVTISPMPSPLDQIAFIKYQITKMIDDGIAAQKIVVITPNEKITKMLELFDIEHYFNFAMGRGIRDHKILEVIKLINKILVDKEPKDIHKFKFLDLDEEKFINIFKNNWKKVITIDLFNDITTYLFSFVIDEDIIEKLEAERNSLELLLFVNINDDFEKILVKDFMKLLQNQISTISIDDVFGGKITVLGILETRLITYDGVIVIDFNDDKIPKISIKDKFISSNLKEKVNLPTLTNRENLQRYYYNSVFSRSKRIALCYVDDDSSVMSRFIVQLFPNYKDLIVKKDYKSILYNKQVLNHFSKDIVVDIDLSTRSWSATSLKTYLSCKRKYYFNYISNIKDHSISIKPEPFEIGNIIHNALEDAVKQNSLNTIFLNNYLSSYQKTNPYLVLELELWKKKLINLIEFERIREQNGIKIFQVEQPFNINYRGLNIKGKIDRVDKYLDNSYEILDYKTSSSLKIDTIKNYEDSVDFQLEFYQIASRDKMIKSVGYFDLNSCSIKTEVVLDEKLDLLNLHLDALKTTKVDFKKTDELSKCQFCQYKTICDV